MNTYLVLKIVHSAAAGLLLLGIIAHLVMLIKAYHGGDQAVLLRKVRNTRCYSSPALAVVALSLPITGGAMAHMVGLPLGQLWLLLSACLLIPLLVFWLLLDGRLRAWLALGEQAAPSSLPRNALIYAVLILITLLAIFAVMGAKPV